MDTLGQFTRELYDIKTNTPTYLLKAKAETFVQKLMPVRTEVLLNMRNPNLTLEQSQQISKALSYIDTMLSEAGQLIR